MFESLESRRLMTISAIAGQVFVYGDNGNDNITVTGTGSDITIAGTAGAGVFLGVRALNIIGAGGNDTITVDNAVTVNSILLGGAGNDNLTGGGGNDGVHGNEGNDVCHGGNGNDRVDGGAGSDLLFGDAGLDIIVAANDKGIDAIVTDALDVVLADKKDLIF